MGYYINEDSTGKPLSKHNKIDALIWDGASPVLGNRFEPNLICVADRLTHHDAIYCYDEREYRRICRGNEESQDLVAWLTHPKAKELSKCPH